MLLPKADRFLWFGVLAAYVPAFLTGSAEYGKTSVVARGVGVVPDMAAECSRREETQEHRLSCEDCVASPRPRLS